MLNAISLGVVACTTVVATYTDLKNQVIYRRLTLPVFLAGLVYSFIPKVEYIQYVSFTKIGLFYLRDIIWAWLSPPLLIFLYSLFLFWLGIFDAGDGHFLISITPWCGMDGMWRIIFYFYPVALIYLVICLLREYKYDWRRLVLHQIKDICILLNCLPVVLNNIKKKEEHVLVKNVPYTNTGIERPPGMIPLSISVILVIL